MINTCVFSCVRSELNAAEQIRSLCLSLEKNKILFLYMLGFFGGGRVYFVRVSPVKAVPYRPVSAAVLCVSVLADGTVPLL